jgi:hypothetical protein
MDENLKNQVLDMLEYGAGKMRTTKFVIDSTGMSLREAKEFVDSISEELTSVNGLTVNKDFTGNIPAGLHADSVRVAANPIVLYSKFEQDIIQGKLPDLVSDFKLKPGEQCIYRNNNCEIIERKMTTTRINYSGPRARIRIAKGFSYNMGTTNISTDREEVDVSLGYGTLNLTTNRILYSNSYKNISIPLNSIVDVKQDLDGVVIYRENKNLIKLNTLNVSRFIILLYSVLYGFSDIDSVISSVHENETILKKAHRKASIFTLKVFLISIAIVLILIVLIS